MKNNSVLKQMIQSGFHSKNGMNKTYDVKLKLTADEISQILDYCLVQKIERAGDDIAEYLSIAENIRSEKLSEEFCQYFAQELTPLLKDLISDKSDSYQMSNFQHRMLRKFSDNSTTLVSTH